MTTQTTRTKATTDYVEPAAVVENVAFESTLSATDGQGLAPYLGVCPTCLGWQAEGDDLDRSHAACPTCGETSVEWELSRQIDEVLREMRGLDALDRAIQAL